MVYQLALELGGTNYAVEFFEISNGIVIPRQRITGEINTFQSLGALLAALTEKAEISLSDIAQIIIAAPSRNSDGIIPNTINEAVGYSGFNLGQTEAGTWRDIPFKIFNDFFIAAHAAADFERARPVWLKGIPVDNPQNRICYMIGPGTGLGQASCIIRPGNNFLDVRGSEGQHNYLPTYNFLNLVKKIYEGLHENQGQGSHVNVPSLTAEEIVSGRGLVRAYNASCRLRGRNLYASKAITIAEAAAEGDKDALQALTLFFYTLGRASVGLIKSHYHNEENMQPVLLIAGGVVPKIFQAMPNRQDYFFRMMQLGIAADIGTNESHLTRVFTDFSKHLAIGYYQQSPGIVGAQVYALHHPALAKLAPNYQIPLNFGI